MARLYPPPLELNFHRNLFSLNGLTIIENNFFFNGLAISGGTFFAVSLMYNNDQSKMNAQWKNMWL